MRLSICILLLVQSMAVLCQKADLFKITVDPELRDTVTFDKQWDYHPKIYQTDSGLYYISGLGIAKPADTSHIYYTAELSLDNDGVEIHYAFANRSEDTLFVKFGQDDPLYLQLLQFRIFILKGKFGIDSIKMPSRINLRDRISYQILSYKLVLRALPSANDQKIFGYIELTIRQTIRRSDEDIRQYDLSAKGYFKTPIQYPPN